jgi:hypothetical protein
MSVNLTSFKNIRTSMFVRIDIPDYAVLRFSDYYRPFVIAGETYDTLGDLMSVGSTAIDLKPTGAEVAVTITGIPNSRLSEVLNTRIKGSAVTIYRGFFNSQTGAPQPIPGNTNANTNILGKFIGRVVNVLINEEYDSDGRSSSVTVQFLCASVVSMLERKIAGRRTNDRSNKAFFPTDTSMDRVQGLARSNINFGAPTV